MFKMPSKYRRYNFQPRYYDERKEKLQKKIASFNGTQSPEQAREIKFRANLEDTWGNSEMKKQTQKANLRLLIILILICFAAYYIFIGLDSAEEIINKNLPQK
jgi:CHASE3 domain sensor protein